jgi:hypothetical protein
VPYRTNPAQFMALFMIEFALKRNTYFASEWNEATGHLCTQEERQEAEREDAAAPGDSWRLPSVPPLALDQTFSRNVSKVCPASNGQRIGRWPLVLAEFLRLGQKEIPVSCLGRGRFHCQYYNVQ